MPQEEQKSESLEQMSEQQLTPTIVVFPRGSNKGGKKVNTSMAQQLVGDIMPVSTALVLLNALLSQRATRVYKCNVKQEAMLA